MSLYHSLRSWFLCFRSTVSSNLFQNTRYYFDVDIAVVHPFVANPSNEFVSVKAYNYDQDPQFFQAFIAAAPKNKIVKKSLDIMLGMLKGTHAARGLSLLGTQSMQDAWAEVAEEDSAYASHGKNNKVYLLSEENLHDDGNGFDKLPVQENNVMSLFSEGTCDYTILSLITGRGVCVLLLSHCRNHLLWKVASSRSGKC